MIGEVKYRGTFGELIQITLGSEHEHLVLVEVHLKLVHRLQAVGGLQHRADIREPLVQSRLTLHTLVTPVRCHATLCHLVHTLGADLYLHPFLLRS